MAGALSAAAAADFFRKSRRGLVGDAVASLNVIEVPRQSEMLEHKARAGGAFGGGGRFPARERRQRFRHAGIEPCVRVTPGAIVERILLAQLLHFRRSEMREE